MATTNRHIWVVGETGGSGTPGFKRVHNYNVGPLLARDERLPSVLPDWRGRLWFVGRQKGTVGVIDPKTGRGRSIRLNEEIENSFATSPEGVYIATDKAMYRFGLARGGGPPIARRGGGLHHPHQKPRPVHAPAPAPPPAPPPRRPAPHPHPPPPPP